MSVHQKPQYMRKSQVHVGFFLKLDKVKSSNCNTKVSGENNNVSDTIIISWKDQRSIMAILIAFHNTKLLQASKSLEWGGGERVLVTEPMIIIIGGKLCL